MRRVLASILPLLVVAAFGTARAWTIPCTAGWKHCTNLFADDAVALRADVPNAVATIYNVSTQRSIVGPFAPCPWTGQNPMVVLRTGPTSLTYVCQNETKQNKVAGIATVDYGNGGATVTSAPLPPSASMFFIPSADHVAVSDPTTGLYCLTSNPPVCRQSNGTLVPLATPFSYTAYNTWSVSLHRGVLTFAQSSALLFYSATTGELIRSADTGITFEQATIHMLGRFTVIMSPEYQFSPGNQTIVVGDAHAKDITGSFTLTGPTGAVATPYSIGVRVDSHIPQLTVAAMLIRDSTSPIQQFQLGVWRVPFAFSSSFNTVIQSTATLDLPKRLVDATYYPAVSLAGDYLVVASDQSPMTSTRPVNGTLLIVNATSLQTLLNTSNPPTVYGNDIAVVDDLLLVFGDSVEHWDPAVVAYGTSAGGFTQLWDGAYDSITPLFGGGAPAYDATAGCTILNGGSGHPWRSGPIVCVDSTGQV